MCRLRATPRARPAGSPGVGPKVRAGHLERSATTQKRGILSSHPSVEPSPVSPLLPLAGWSRCPERKKLISDPWGSLFCLSWAYKSVPGLAQLRHRLLGGAVRKARSLRCSVPGLGTF